MFVSLVEPPNLRMDTLDLSIRRVVRDGDAYEDTVVRLAASFHANGERRAVRPEHVARLVERIMMHPRPALRYPLGTRSRLLPLVKAVLPQGVFEWAVRRHLHLPDSRRATSS